MKQTKQMQFIPFMCGLNGCANDAVCALQHKINPELHFNVCPSCYEKVTGNKWAGSVLAD
jgi:hypothetical protein